MEPPSLPVRHSDDGPPPFLGSWPRVYTAVVGYLLLLIALLYGITRLFNY